VLGCAAMAVVILSKEQERPLGSLSLWVYEAAVGARRCEVDRRRVRLAGTGRQSGGASKRLTDGAEEAVEESRRGRWCRGGVGGGGGGIDGCARAGVCWIETRRKDGGLGHSASAHCVLFSLRRVGWEGRMKQRCDGE
jgi:hypothetical protein